MTGREQLSGRLRLLRRRMLLIGSGAGLTWGVVAAAVCWLLMIWLDLLWELSPRTREVSNVVAAVAGIGLLAIVVRRWRARGSDGRLARRLDRACDAQGQIATGWELSATAANSTPSSPATPQSQLTAGLAQIVVDRAAQLAADVPPEKVVTRSALRAPSMTLAAIAVGLALVALLSPRLLSIEWLRFVDPFGDHPPFSLVQFTVTPGDTQVLYGGGLDVRVTTSGPPVEQVDLVLAGGGDAAEETLPMFQQQDGAWRAMLTSVTTQGEYFVRARRSRSPRYALDVITVPRLEDVQFHVEQPAYTRRAPYEGPLPADGLAGLAGTIVRVTAKSNRPLSGGEIQIQTTAGPQAVELKHHPLDNHRATGEFTLNAADKFTIQVRDVANVCSQETLSGSLVLLADQRPLVRVIQPAATALATPEATLPVVLAGEDDYGITRLELFRSLNQSRGLPMEFDLPKPELARSNPQQALPLAAYGLSPGDEIKLYARIEDNDPAGVKGSESPICTVKIISQSEYEQMLRAREGLEVLQSKYRQAERRMEALAEQREGLRKKNREEPESPADEMREQLKKLAEQMRKDAAADRQALEHLLPYDLDQALSERLAKLAEKLDKAAQQAEDLANEGKMTREDLEKLLDALEQQLEEQREEFRQEALEPLEQLEAIFPLLEDQARFVELYKQQRELAERMASLKGNDGQDDPLAKGRMRDLEAEQQRVRVALGELLSDIESHAARLPEDEELDDFRASALEFADAVRASGASEAMTEAEAGLSEFSGTRGHAGALKAADILEKFIEKSQQMAAEGRKGLAFKPQLAAGLGDTVAQLLADLGLQPGDGSGNGSGGGSSSRRNSLDNVGLYGRMPGVGDTASNGSRGDKSGPGRGAGGPSPTNDDQSTLIDLPGALRASGASGATIPAGYRRRVGAYFQRIIEDRSK